MKRSSSSEDLITMDDVFKQYLPKIQAIIEKLLPRTFTTESMKHYFGEPQYAYDEKGATNALLVPMWDLLDRGGKRWRPVLVALIAEILEGKDEVVFPAAFLCELVHNGTLCVDDIEDDSKMRRGKPCLHLIYKVDISINVGNAMYFMPLAELRELHRKKLVSPEILLRAYEFYGEEMNNLHLGQGLDIWWHQGHAMPTEQQYLQMCAYKTGVLARLSARLAALLSGASDDVIHQVGLFSEAIGVAFQIQDDLLNISGEEFAEKISIVGEDIYEGKRTLMVIHSAQNSSPEKAKRLEEILNMKTRDPILIKEATDIMKASDSLTYAAGVAQKLVQKAWENVSHILPDKPAKKKLQVFADYLINRKI